MTLSTSSVCALGLPEDFVVLLSTYRAPELTSGTHLYIFICGGAPGGLAAGKVGDSGDCSRHGHGQTDHDDRLPL